jgi:hypothetical protein
LLMKHGQRFRFQKSHGIACPSRAYPLAYRPTTGCVPSSRLWVSPAASPLRRRVPPPLPRRRLSDGYAAFTATPSGHTPVALLWMGRWGDGAIGLSVFVSICNRVTRTAAQFHRRRRRVHDGRAAAARPIDGCRREANGGGTAARRPGTGASACGGRACVRSTTPPRPTSVPNGGRRRSPSWARDSGSLGGGCAAAAAGRRQSGGGGGPDGAAPRRPASVSRATMPGHLASFDACAPVWPTPPCPCGPRPHVCSAGRAGWPPLRGPARAMWSWSGSASRTSSSAGSPPGAAVPQPRRRSPACSPQTPPHDCPT